MKVANTTKTLKDFMTRGIVTICAQASIQDVVDTLARNNISSVPVVSVNGGVMGIISDMDVLRTMRTPGWMNSDAECIISRNGIISVPASTTVDEAARIMVEKHIHRLLVLSEKGIGGTRKPIGIVTAGDIIKMSLA